MINQEQADLFAMRIRDWELNSMSTIGKSIKRYGKLTAEEIKQINNAAVAKAEMDSIFAELAKVSKKNISEIEKIYSDAIEKNHLANKPLYDYRGKKFVPITQQPHMQAIISAYAKTTAYSFINVTKTSALGFQVGDKVVKMDKAIQDVLGKAVTAVSTGTNTFDAEMRHAVKQLGGGGARVQYAGGTRRLDTVIRQNMLYGLKQVTQEYQTIIGEELGCDGIEVDYHSNPRPSHEFMQGKQYALGKSRFIDGEYFESADKALEAMDEYGCLHYPTSIICGVSQPRYSPEQLAEFKKRDNTEITIGEKSQIGYEWKQDMRALESGMRQLEGEITTLKASGMTYDAELQKLNAYRDKYVEISEATGIKAQWDRASSDLKYRNKPRKF